MTAQTNRQFLLAKRPVGAAITNNQILPTAASTAPTKWVQAFNFSP